MNISLIWQIIVTISVTLLAIIWFFNNQKKYQSNNGSYNFLEERERVCNMLHEFIIKINREAYLCFDDMEFFKTLLDKENKSLFYTQECQYFDKIKKNAGALYKVSTSLRKRNLSKKEWDKYSKEQMTLLEWFSEQEKRLHSISRCNTITNSLCRNCFYKGSHTVSR